MQTTIDVAPKPLEATKWLSSWPARSTGKQLHLSSRPQTEIAYLVARLWTQPAKTVEVIKRHLAPAQKLAGRMMNEVRLQPEQEAMACIWFAVRTSARIIMRACTLC